MVTYVSVHFSRPLPCWLDRLALYSYQNVNMLVIPNIAYLVFMPYTVFSGSSKAGFRFLENNFVKKISFTLYLNFKRPVKRSWCSPNMPAAKITYQDQIFICGRYKTLNFQIQNFFFIRFTKKIQYMVCSDQSGFLFCYQKKCWKKN